MERPRPLAPCMIGRGTVSAYRDMVRALETVENVEYRYVLDGQEVSSGRASLVKLMADSSSATMCVNGCLFLNVGSFRFLDFEQVSANIWSYTLVGDGTAFELTTVPDPEDATPRPQLIIDDSIDGYESFVTLDEEDDAED